MDCFGKKARVNSPAIMNVSCHGARAHRDIGLDALQEALASGHWTAS